MSRTFRMKSANYPYGDPTPIAKMYNKSVYAYMAGFFGDKRSGRRNASSTFRRFLESTRRSKAKMALRSAVDFDEVIFDPVKKDANWNWF
jgi:hypothetical protein